MCPFLIAAKISLTVYRGRLLFQIANRRYTEPHYDLQAQTLQWRCTIPLHDTVHDGLWPSRTASSTVVPQNTVRDIILLLSTTTNNNNNI